MIDEKYITSNEHVLILGTGDKKTRGLSTVTLPSVLPLKVEDMGGYYHLGFMTTKE